MFGVLDFEGKGKPRGERDNITSAEAITLLRGTVEEQGVYDKDYIRKSMMAHQG